MGKPLPNSPLVETLVEFRFKHSETWDWAIPGMLYENVRADYPNRETVNASGVFVGQGSMVQTGPVGIPERLRFKSSKNDVMLQVGPDLLVLNRTENYEGWDKFLARAMKAFKAYIAVVRSGWELHRLGLRYINAIPFDSHAQRFEDYVTVFPAIKGRLEREQIADFHQRFVFNHTTPPGGLLLQVGLKPYLGKQHLMVDFDFGNDAVGNLKEVDAITTWLDRAHGRIEDAFMATFTSAAYTRFENG